MDSDYDYRFEEKTYPIVETCKYCGENIIECDGYLREKDDFYHLECFLKQEESEDDES